MASALGFLLRASMCGWVGAGYWGKPEKTAEVFFKDTKGKLWFRSGDIGRMDEDSYVYILDR